MAHHEQQECCILMLCCGSPEKRIEALAGLLRDNSTGPDKYDEMAAILVERKLVRMSSVFVAPAFFTTAEVAGFLEAFHRGRDKYVAMATALLDQGYVVSVSEFIWPPVLAELREGLECIGIPYDGKAVSVAKPVPMVTAAVEPEPVVEPAEELVVPPKPKTRPKATPKRVVPAKKK